MNKEWFNVKTENIEVPVDELFTAIDKGIEKGRRKKKNKKKTKLAVSITSIAASLLLVSGFVFSPMTKVLASVPVIGSIYKSFDMKMGKELEAKNLVTKISQTASDKGITITLTSVYYDGIYIGITFKAEGEPLAKFEEKCRLVLDQGFSLWEKGISEFDYYLYKMDGMKWSGGGRDSHLQKVGDYYKGAMEMQFIYEQLPKDFTLPITFENMGGVKGNWHFEIPVKQLPLKTLTFENSTSQDENYSFTMKSMIIGKSNIRLDYKTSIPMDFLNFKIIDDKGNDLSEALRSLGSDSAIFETGIGDTKYLVIYPQHRGYLKYIDLEPLKVNVQDN
ncbi:DUF4179 domain-containing protein [Heyndrickxia sp. NPDC080065]|uniref:DUF4179 domain-containing protein n=1 Tax=Heyndrickxia sp. NPDC080065 TaxID=3390568 RepID=UPI003D072A34